MKLFFRIIFKMFLILTILAGYATTEGINETDSDELLNQGLILLEEGQYDRAIAYFNKAIEINPKDVSAYGNRGIAYDYKGQYDKAISDYTKVIEINPSDALAYNNRGLAYVKKGQYDKAISDFNKVIELNPRAADAYNNRGWAYHNKGQYDKAISDYNKAIEINPRDSYAYNNRRIAYDAKGDKKGVMTFLILAFTYAGGLSLVAVYLRLSSKIIIRKPLNWKLCFKLTGVLFLFMILSHAVQTIVLPDYSSAKLALGIIVQLLVSASFLNRYGKLPDGGKIGWITGFKIAGLATLFGIITLIIFRIWIMIWEMILQP